MACCGVIYTSASERSSLVSMFSWPIFLLLPDLFFALLPSNLFFLLLRGSISEAMIGHTSVSVCSACFLSFFLDREG
ncbi:hypothetical protein F5141DRAFT_452695 [Pisolithus sp. B1]|nr:hypothetical protein F5141DRAFT_452695 [Pisolithus sp. B1]